MIRVNNIHKSFGDLKVLKGINYHIKKGEKIVVVLVLQVQAKAPS